VACYAKVKPHRRQTLQLPLPAAVALMRRHNFATSLAEPRHGRDAGFAPRRFIHF